MDGERVEDFEYASEQDELDARQDALLYGNVFLRRDEDGLMHRIDPTTVQVSKRVEDSG